MKRNSTGKHMLYSVKKHQPRFVIHRHVSFHGDGFTIIVALYYLVNINLLPILQSTTHRVYYYCCVTLSTWCIFTV